MDPVIDDTQDNIDPAEMDDAALDAAINGTTEPTGQDDAGQATNQDDNAGSDNSDAGQSTSTDTSNIDAGQQGGDDQGGKGADGGDDPLAAIQKQLDDAQAFIQRQAQEIGALRKGGQPKPNPDALNELYYSNPAQAVQQTVQQTLAEQQQVALENEAQIRQVVPEITDSAFREEIGKLALEDGFSQENVNAFMQNLGSSEPEVVARYAERVRHGRALAEKEGQITELNNKVAELEKKLASSSADVASKIAAATKTPSKLNSNSGQGGDNQGAVSEAQLATLSDAELDDLIKQ